MRRPTPEQIVELLDLQPLPAEGGDFRQSFLSDQVIPEGVLGERYREAKPALTAIYYLITSEGAGFSAMHRLPTAEIFHFYLGDPVETLLLYPGGESRTVRLGPDILAGEKLQFTVPPDVWQGSALLPGGEFALLGTTMAPGYTQSDFCLGVREELIDRWPRETERITALTRQ